MSILASNFEALLMFSVGLYLTFLAIRGVPLGTAKMAEWQRWYANWGRLAKFVGPIMMLMGLAEALRKLAV